MSNTTEIVIKLLAALTSPKACVKYLTVALTLYLSWVFLPQYFEQLEISTEQKSLIILLFGVGSGALIAHTFSEIVISIYKKAHERINESKKEKEKEKTNDALLKKLDETFYFLGDSQRELLRALTKRNKTEEINENIKSLIDNNFIQLEMKITKNHRNIDVYLISLNPILKDFLVQHWNNEIEGRIDDFYNIHGSQADKLLNLMKKGNDSKINPSILNNINNSFGIIQKGYDDRDHIENSDTGIFLYFDDYVCERLSEKNNIEYLDEVFIKNERLTEY
ncbi:MAG: hypothetical protein HRT97_05730 [Moritella sp.]|uniref:hypothetical protein n=1 Tax=Moritella sp. TaxID=78556 RepID=UPI0025CDF024|nr:hypothetical protein [Moritella sp.]NQZ91830.1 hypothetical protein [Moritella sp.]